MNKMRGYTLIEMLVVMVILSIVMVIVTQFISNQATILRKQQLLTNTQQNLRAAGEAITRDLQMACLNPMGVVAGQPNSFEFKVTSPNAVEFTMDQNGNGIMNGADTTWTQPRRDEYRGFYIQRSADTLHPDTLKRPRDATHTTPAAEDVAVGIENLTFRYFDKNGLEVFTDAGGQIARVEFRIEARSAIPYRTRPRYYITRVDSTSVMVRNRAF